MTQTAVLITELYAGVDRLTSDEVVRRAVAANVPAGVIVQLESVPEGEYSQDEFAEAVAVAADSEPTPSGMLGVEPSELTDDELLRELYHVHRTRHETFRHGSDDALGQHDRRTAELEAEYLRRFPAREVDERRLRP